MRSSGFTLIKPLVVASMLWIAPRLALAGCCQLVKVEPAPATVRVRVCALEDGPGCVAPLFDGELAHGAPVSICAVETAIVYRELDPLSGELMPPTTAACSATANVEL